MTKSTFTVSISGILIGIVNTTLKVCDKGFTGKQYKLWIYFPLLGNRNFYGVLPWWCLNLSVFRLSVKWIFVMVLQCRWMSLVNKVLMNIVLRALLEHNAERKKVLKSLKWPRWEGEVAKVAKWLKGEGSQGSVTCSHTTLSMSIDAVGKVLVSESPLAAL